MEHNDDFKPRFNYGQIQKEHLDVVNEIINLANESQNIVFAEFLKWKFNIKEVKKYDLTKNKFLNAAQKAGVFCSIQGTIREGEKEGAIEYPVISITEDPRKLEKIYEAIEEIVKNEK